MNPGNDALKRDLNEIVKLLIKYQHYGQARVVGEILATLNAPRPDYERLCGIDVWGGAGAVWEVNLRASQNPEEAKVDRTAFYEAFIRLVETMNQMEIGTDRSRHIGATFQNWLDKGL